MCKQKLISNKFDLKQTIRVLHSKFIKTSEPEMLPSLEEMGAKLTEGM
jgi:hypothetical protein